MKYLTDTEHIKLNNTVVTIGKFDGNHIGHRFLFNTVVSLKEYAMDAVVLTFGRKINSISGNNKSLMTNLEKQSFSYPEGIDYVIEMEFNDELKNMLPEKFVESFLVKKLGVKKIVVGNDFCFGKDRSGDIRTLYDLGQHFGFEVFPMEKIKYDGIEVSSTYIRQKIREGDMYAAEQMLGEPFSVTGRVLKGKQLGRTIGFPTINFIADNDKILPPDGGYATKTVIDGKSHMSITNVGMRPTVEESTVRTIETYILDFNEDLYDKTVKVEFYDYLRPEEKFDSLEELQAEIEKNIEEVKSFFQTESTQT